MARGLQAYREQAKAATERRASGFANQVLLKEGESVIGRFRGLFRTPAVIYTKADLETFDEANLGAISWTLGLGTYEKIDEWVDAILRRYQQIEPFTYGEHFCKRAAKGQQYTSCGNSFEPKLQCVGCVAKRGGDRGISYSDKVAFSFLPNRMYHSWESNRPGQKKGFAYCDGDGCRLCAQGHPAKWEGMKYFSLASMHAEGILAAEERVRARCVSCQGMGRIKLLGYMCPYCQTALNVSRDANGLLAKAPCPNCGTKMTPQENVECQRGCEVPRRVELFDVDILVQRLTGGTKTTYAFNEQFPCEPLDNERLLIRLPGYEAALKPPDVNEQCARYGLVRNPFTGQAIASAPDAESFDESEEDEGTPIPDATDEDIPY